MIRTTAALLGLWLATTLPAQKGDAGGAASESLAAIKKEYDAATSAQRASMQALTKSDEYKKAVEAKDQAALKALRDERVKPVDGPGFAARALAAAERQKGDERVPYYMFAAMAGGKPEIAAQVVDALQKDHVTSPRLLEVFESFAALRAVQPARAKEFLDAVIEKNPSDEVKGWAYYVQSRNAMRDRNASDEDKAKAQEMLAKAEQLAKGTKSYDLFAAPRFEKENLQIGQVCPDIVGEDVDGVAFKLSDYKGKVVVLDFWGFW
jgi:hypothetical protein